MDITKILEYQEIDMELRRHESEIEKNEDYRIARQAKNDFLTSKDAAEKCDKKAAELIAYYAKIKKYYDENHDKVEALSAELSKQEVEADIDALYEVSDQLDKLGEMFLKGERELNALLRKIEEINKTFEDNRKGAMVNKKVFATSRAKFEEFRKAKTPVIDELKAKLDNMAKTIDPKLMTRYSALRKDRVFPAFVQLEGGKRCGGCRMDQSSGHLSNLNESGIIECESCRRIIYK